MRHLRYDGNYRLSLFMELSQGVDVNYVMSFMLPGHVSQGPFHSYGVRRHLVNRARNDVLHKNKLKEKLFSICHDTHQRKSGTWPLQTTPHPRARRAGIVGALRYAGRCILLFTETFSFQPLQQGKTHYQLPGMASANSADIECRETSPENTF